MPKKRGGPDYASVFESGGRSRRERLQLSATDANKPGQRGSGTSPVFDADEVVQFVEDQVRAITAAVRLAAPPLPAEPSEDQEDTRAVPTWCAQCETDEVHLHRSKLYLHGVEQF